MAEPFVTIDLPGEAATEFLAEDVAACLRQGDTIALLGDLGTGKTTFARALIRSLAGDPLMEVPSPTFTLVQTYTTQPLTVAHVDLYRVADQREIEDAGLLDAGADITVIEWAERAGALLHPDRLEVRLEMTGDGRRADISGGGDWGTRLAPSRAARAFLTGNAFHDGHRFAMRRDVTPCRGEHIVTPRRLTTLLDWGPQERNGQAAAEFAAASTALNSIGLSEPQIIALDATRGLALTEDFGTETLVGVDGAPVAERYFTAIEALAEIHVKRRPDVVAMPNGPHHLRNLDGEKLAAKARLFSTVYVGNSPGGRLPADEEGEFEQRWWSLFERLVEVERGWVLEPIGSKTVSWLPKQAGLRRASILPLYGVHTGPTAYDVACLCQDHGATIDPELEGELRRHYVALRKAAYARFDGTAFEMAYAIVAALRASAALGFTGPPKGLDPEEAKARFPRLLAYLRRALAHPVLSDLAVWYDRRLPTVA